MTIVFPSLSFLFAIELTLHFDLLNYAFISLQLEK